MKGQLYIGDDMVAETVEVVSSPRSGDLLIFEGKRLRIREVGHNVDRKKLQIMCHVPPTPLRADDSENESRPIPGNWRDYIEGDATEIDGE